MQQRVFIIGLDSLDFELASKWARDGHMPNFKRLINDSRWGQINNPLDLEAGACWPCFGMGVGPEVHGQFMAPYIFDPSDYEMRVRRPDEWSVDPFWVTASKAGKRVSLIDVPYFLIDKEFEGLQVADWYTHVRTYSEGLTTKPLEFAQQILSKYGDNPFADPRRCPTNHIELDCASKVSEFRDQLLNRIAAKTAFTLDLLKRNQWDLLFSVFHDAHDVGHMCWHLHDTGHERYDPLIAAEAGDPIFAIYIALDEAIGTLANSVGPDTTLLLYLTHGMGTECTGSYFLDLILRKLEESYYGNGSPTQLDQVRKSYRRLVPSFIRQKLNQMKTAKIVYEKNLKTMHQRRRFFETIPNHATGGVRVNMSGREKFGIINSGQEFDTLCTRLCKDLREIINLDSGEPIANSLTLTTEIYDGPKIEELPDILLDWNGSAQIKKIFSPLFGTLANPTKSVRTGDHINRAGFYFSTGTGLSPGQNPAPVDVVDFAPTVLALLDIDIRDKHYSGQVIESLVSGPSAIQRLKSTR